MKTPSLFPAIGRGGLQDLGMVWVLLALCALFSVLTRSEQQPVGAAAAAGVVSAGAAGLVLALRSGLATGLACGFAGGRATCSAQHGLARSATVRHRRLRMGPARAGPPWRAQAARRRRRWSAVGLRQQRITHH